MGYASYLEDIRDKLARDLFEPMKKEVASLPDYEIKTRFEAFVRHGETLIKKITELIDLVTNPDVNLAAEVHSLQDENDKLNSQCESLKRQLENLKSQSRQSQAALRKKLEDERGKREDVEEKLKRVEANLEYLLQDESSPDFFRKILDRYTPPR